MISGLSKFLFRFISINYNKFIIEKSLKFKLPKMGLDYKTGNSNEFREMTSRVCKDYLRGSWKKISPSNIQIKRISGGLSNWLYHVSLPSTLPPRGHEPQEVLLRIYGQVHGERALESLVTESVIFTLLSERRLGPALYGVFPGGRIEEYIPARPLKTCELGDLKLSALIAEKMALIHRMNVPISKEPRWLWNNMKRWLATVRANLKDPGTLQELDQYHIDKLSKVNFVSEVDWLREFLSHIKSPVVFCHNDLQEGNILLKTEKQQTTITSSEDLVVIDFEYCAYNHRGFDLANHFAEWRYDYTNPEWPHFYRDGGKPTLDQKIHFVRKYLQTMGDHNTNPEDILEEIEAFTLASHLFWTLWSIVNAKISQIPFGYWEYAVERLDKYYKLKNTLILNQNLQIEGKEES